MNHLTRISTLALSSMLVFAACGKVTGPADQLSTTTGSRIAARAGQIIVTATDGEPIANAKILIGMRKDSPFPGNFIVTDANGQAAAPAQWKSPEAVTIEAAGFVRTTYFARTSANAAFQLKRSPQGTPNELKGDTTGYANLKSDGFVDVSIVLPNFSRSELANLSIPNLVSVETDTMKIMGQSFQIPSNLAIPSQQETYILPITLAKPTYRIFFPSPGNYKVSAVHARFKMQEIADDLQNGVPFTEIINKFDFLEGGTKAVTVKPGTTITPIPINANPFSPSISVVAPNFDNRLAMVSMAVPEMGGDYTISDVKRLTPQGKITLVAPKAGVAKALVVSVLKAAPTRGKDGVTGAAADTYSTTITTAARVQAPEFLDIPQAPRADAKALVLAPPRKLTGVEPSMTVAVLSKVELLDKGKYKLEKKTPQWELYANDWAQSLDLPEWPESVPQPKGSMRWEAAFVGQSPKRDLTTPGPAALEKVTHVTRSAVDF